MIRSSQPTSRSLIALAWAVALVVSALPDILAYELTGAVPGWLLWFKGGLLCVLIIYTYFCEDTHPLRSFFIVLLAFSLLTSLYTWLLQTPAFLSWHGQQSFGIAALAQQVIEMIVALLLVGLLLLLRKRRAACFLVRGDLSAQVTPVRGLGQNPNGPLWQFGLIFTAVVIVAQIFMFIVPLVPSAGMWLKLLTMLPLILLLAASNAFNEESILRAAPIASVIEAVGPAHAIGIAAVLFGLSHYIGGVPDGIVGVLITTLLGWFFGKCMIDSRGFFWPWLFHALQDLLPFAFMALS